MSRSRLRYLLDYSMLPLFMAGVIAATYKLLVSGIAPSLITLIVFPPMIAIVLILEQLFPERADGKKLDQPLRYDIGHFILGNQGGTMIGYGAVFVISGAIASLLSGHLDLSIWPKQWPLPLQIIFALALGEGVSYWQHRLAHRLQWFWNLHALHHSGKSMNIVRVARFHFFDNATACFLLFIPLALLGAPPAMFAWVGVLCGMLGLTQHANIRMRTPRWLDRLICTPAVHRFHHSKLFNESNGNFGTTVMIFDHLFGSYVAPQAAGPQEYGIENDPVPRGFWQQFWFCANKWREEKSDYRRA